MPTEQKLVDIHVHLAAFPTAVNGCYVSPGMLKKRLAGRLLKRLQLDPADPEGGNRRYVEILAHFLRTSRRVGRAVLLALDGVYTSNGEPDAGRTSFVVSNDYLFRVCRENTVFLPGVSINPARRDALDELDRCAAAGAVLVKWLPNTQGFDPADSRYRPYYRRLARLGLPLLSHTGYEFALVALDQALGDPGRLRPALEEGVTVISAHGGSLGLCFWQKHWPTVRRLIRNYPNYYLDSSALCLPNRWDMASKIRRSPELQSRLLYGSDYPVPAMASSFVFQLRPEELWRLAREPNPIEKNAAIQQALGYQFAELPSGTRLRERAIAASPGPD